MNRKTADPAGCIVGIGASAGGLEALRLLLEHLDPDTSMAYIIVQHLSPDYKSLLAELLAPHTGMPVLEAAHMLALRPNHVYVIPPGKNLTVRGGCIRLTSGDG